jgi:beta-galactosidase
MYDALYELNVEPDFVQAGDPNLSLYKVLLVPPLYTASDRVLQQLSDHVNKGGQVTTT